MLDIMEETEDSKMGSFSSEPTERDRSAHRTIIQCKTTMVHRDQGHENRGDSMTNFAGESQECFTEERTFRLGHIE